MVVIRVRASDAVSSFHGGRMATAKKRPGGRRAPPPAYDRGDFRSAPRLEDHEMTDLAPSPACRSSCRVWAMAVWGLLVGLVVFPGAARAQAPERKVLRWGGDS